MVNTANRQCPNCRSMDIHESYVVIQLFFRCRRCCHVWNA